MADLSNVGLNPDVEETGAGFEVLPAGEYSVVITSDEVRDNKAGTGKLIALSLKVTAGKFTGVALTDYLNLKNPNATAEAIGQGTLKKICSLCGTTYPPSNTLSLYGKPMNVKVSVDEFTSNNTGAQLKSNKIKGYLEHKAVVDAVAPPAPNQPATSGW